MADDLRARVLAAVRKGLAGPLDTPKTKKAVRGCEAVDSAIENGVREVRAPHTAFTNKIKSLTPSHALFTNRDSQPGKPEPAESLAYQATSAGPDGAVCKVTIVELPQAQRYRKTFAFLQTKCPSLIPVTRWKACVEDGKRFLAKWGNQAESLGWTTADLFGLHTPPANPHPSYSRLSRYDCTGLCWLLQGRRVTALTEATAAIENPTGNITVYRRFNKPGYGDGPVGDSLDDFQ